MVLCSGDCFLFLLDSDIFFEVFGSVFKVFFELESQTISNTTAHSHQKLARLTSLI